MISRTRTEYFTNKEKLASNGIQVILVDMAGHAVDGSIQASDKLFFEQEHAAGSYFALYCGSGCSISGYTANKLQKILPQYHFIDITGGAGMYTIEKDNYLYDKRL